MNPSFVLQTAGMEELSRTSILTLKNLIFKLGDGSNYTPTRSDSLHGSVVYTGQVTGYSYEGDQTLGLKIRIPPEAGPFAFGEIGIYLTYPGYPEFDALLALVAFKKKQDKLQEATSGISSTWVFTCYIKFAQARTVFNVMTNGNACFPVADDFNNAGVPGSYQNAIIVNADTYDSNPVFMIRKNNTLWYPVGWCHIVTLATTLETDAPCVESAGPLTLTPTNSTLTIKHSGILKVPQTLSRGHYIIQDNNGAMALVDTVNRDKLTVNDWSFKSTDVKWLIIYGKCCDTLTPSNYYDPIVTIAVSGFPVVAGAAGTIPRKNTVFTFTLSAPSTDFTKSDIVVTGGTFGPLVGSGRVYRATWTATPASTSGSVSIAADSFTDEFGNPNVANPGFDSVTFDYIAADNVPPVVKVTVTKNANGTIARSGTIFTFETSETSYDFVKNSITVTGGKLGTLTKAGTTYTAVYTADDYSVEGSVSVAANKFTDTFGNYNVANPGFDSVTFGLGVGPSTATSISPAAQLVSGKAGTALTATAPYVAYGFPDSPPVTYTWSLATNPYNGLSFDTTTGVISGTPTNVLAWSTSQITITATSPTTGGTAKTATAKINLSVVGDDSISITPLQQNMAGQVNNSISPTKVYSLLGAPAGYGAPVYTITPALPAGMSINSSTGVISGTPTAMQTLRGYTVTATITSPTGTLTATAQVDVQVISATAVPIAISPAIQTIYSTSGTAITSTIAYRKSGFSGTVTYSWDASPALGLTLSPTTGVVSGSTAMTIGSVGLRAKVTATDGTNSATSIIDIYNNWTQGTYKIAPADKQIAYTAGTAVPTNASYTATGFDGALAYAVDTGFTLPSGLTMSPTTGVITGTTSDVLINKSIIIQGYHVTDYGTQRAYTSVTFDKASTTPTPPTTTASISPATNTFTGTQNVPVNVNAYTKSGFSGTVTFSVSPSLPSGLTIDSATGGISGTSPSQYAASDYTITATDGTHTATATLKLSIGAPTSTATLSPASTTKVWRNKANVGTPTFTTTGFTAGATLSYSITPVLPTGLNIDTATGVVSGTLSVESATKTYTITATDGTNSGTAKLILTIKPELVLTPEVFDLNVTHGVAITPTAGYTATGFDATDTVSFSWNFSDTVGLTFNTATGVISGTPLPAIGVSQYQVIVTAKGLPSQESVTRTFNLFASS